MPKLCFLSLFVLLVSGIFAQVETENPTSDFIYKGRYYVPGRPWIIVGGGYGYNGSEKVFEPNFMVDGHYSFANKTAIGTGFLTSRNQFLDHDSPAFFLPHGLVEHSINSLHATYGYRFETLWNNLAFFAGPSFNWGYRFSHIDAKNRMYHIRYYNLGLYMNAQYARKLYYDIGLGFSAWFIYSDDYKAGGLSVILFLSSSFKRNI